MNKKIFQVKVSAGCKTDHVSLEGELLKVRTKAPREKGKANAAVCALIAQFFEIPKGSVCLVRGETSPVKWIEVTFSNTARHLIN